MDTEDHSKTQEQQDSQNLTEQPTPKQQIQQSQSSYLSYTVNRKAQLSEARFLIKFFAICFFSITVLFFIYRSIWIPVIIGVIAGCLINPFIEKLSQRMNVPRWGIIVGTIIPCAVFIITMAVIISRIAFPQILEMANNIPNTWDKLVNAEQSITEQIASFSHVLAGFIEYGESQNILPLLSNLNPQYALTALTVLWNSSVPGVLSFFVGLCVAPCMMYMSVRYADLVQTQVMNLIPSKYSQVVIQICSRLFQSLRQVILGQINVACVLGILYTISYTILGEVFDVNGGFAVGVAAGIGRLIPYMDMVTALILSSTAIISSSVSFVEPFIISLLIITVVSIVDAIYVTPKFLGGSVGIHPVIVICSIIAFSGLLGFWGIIIAIPVVALLKESITIILEYYQKLKSSHIHSSSDHLSS